ncbi:MAG: hypothetical protein ACYC5R_04405 [Melioribacteraceae bacterium]
MNILSDFQNITVPCYMYIDDMFASTSFNLLQISRFTKLEMYSSVYFVEGCKNNFPLFKYIKNPLLPKKISNELNHFHSSFTSMQDMSHFRSSKENVFIIVDHDDFNEKNKSDLLIFYKPADAMAFKSYKDFVNSLKSLLKELVKWLNKNGLKDISISKDDINVFDGHKYSLH